MSHMVIYRGADGKPGYHQTDDIHDAVMYVESLRNDKDVDHARIFRLEEVTFEYKPYYRVEINTGTAGAVTAGGMSETSGSLDSGSDVVETSESNGNGIVKPPVIKQQATDEVDDSDDDDSSSDEIAADDLSDSDDIDESSDSADDSDDDDVAPASGARRGLFGR